MTHLVRLSNGDTQTSEQFRKSNPNLVFSGDFPSKDYLTSIGATVIVEDDPITKDMVNAERKRRREEGYVVSVIGYPSDIHLEGRDEDLSNLNGLALLAQLRITQGDTTTLTRFRGKNDVDHLLTPAQVVEMVSTATQWVSALYEASWTLRDADPTPQDYRDDVHWP